MTDNPKTIECGRYGFILEAYQKSKNGIKGFIPFEKLPHELKSNIIAYLIKKPK